MKIRKLYFRLISKKDLDLYDSEVYGLCLNDTLEK